MRLAKLSRTLLLLALPAFLAPCAFAQEHSNVQPNAVRNRLMGQATAKSQTGTARSARSRAEKPAGVKAAARRRDPFETLLNKAGTGGGPPRNLPPGKAGLIVATLRINGIVDDSHGMIAIVSNPQNRVYFLKDGDKLYDGTVEKISLDSISFHEFGKDAFGKPIERQVTKRLYPSPGEQQ